MTLKVELGSNGEIELTDVAEAIALVHRERDFFNWLTNLVPPNKAAQNPPPSRVTTEGWQKIQNAAESGDLEATKEALVQLYGGTENHGPWPLSTSPAGQFLKKLASRDPGTANMMAWLFLRTDAYQPRDHQQFPALGAASVGVTAIESGLAGTDATLGALTRSAEALTARAAQTQNELTRALEDFSSRAQEVVAEAQNEATQQRDSAAEEWDTFKANFKGEFETERDYYRKEMALAEPVTYWRDVSITHRKWARAWGAIFGALLAGSLALLVGYAEGIKAFLVPSVTNGFDFGRLAYAIAVGSVGFWGLRMVARVFLSHYHRAADADERRTMAMTFLALRRQDHIKDDQLDLVLGPLFRPGTTGIVKDDAAPAYGPHNWLTKQD